MNNPTDNDSPPKSWLSRMGDVLNFSAPSDMAELKDMLKQAVDSGVLDQQLLPLLEGALSVRDMFVREIMVPLSQVVCVPIHIDVDDMLNLVIKSGHSRFPVMSEIEGDIRGILHAKDLLPLALSSEEYHFDLKDRIRSVSQVPESMQLDSLLQAFRATRNHMAVVINEYGAVAGVVTIEDVLEQIVGDIADEYDIDDEGLIKETGKDGFIVKAVTPISDFNEFFGTDFASAEYETIGGIILHEFSRMPERDEQIEIAGLRVVVLNASSRRLSLLQVSRCEKNTDPTPADETS